MQKKTFAIIAVLGALLVLSTFPFASVREPGLQLVEAELFTPTPTTVSPEITPTPVLVPGGLATYPATKPFWRAEPMKVGPDVDHTGSVHPNRRPCQCYICVDKGKGATYCIGESIQVCCSAGQPMHIRVWEITSRESSIIWEGYDSGLGLCLYGTVDPPTGKHTFRIEAIESGCIICSDETWIYVEEDTTGPSIGIPSESDDPINKEGCPDPTEVTIACEITDDCSGVDRVTLYYRKIGDVRWETRTMRKYPYKENHYRRTIGPFSEAGTLEYYIKAWDNEGNSSKSSTYTITIKDCLTTITASSMVPKNPVHILPLQIQVTQDGRAVEGVSIARQDDGKFTTLVPPTDSKGIMRTSYYVDSPATGGFNPIFYAAAPQDITQDTAYVAFPYRASIVGYTPDLVLDRWSAFWLRLELLLKEAMPSITDPSNFIPNEYLEKVFSAILLFIKIVTEWQTYNPQVGDVISQRIYEYSLPDGKYDYQYYLEIQRDGASVYSGSLWAKDLTQLPTTELGVLIARLESSAVLCVTDPLGRRLGVDPFIGQLIKEIPSAAYSGHDTEPQVLAIFEPIDGIYTFTLKGTAQGTYQFGTGAFDNQTGRVSTRHETGTITAGEMKSYTVNYPPSFKVYLPIILKIAD